MERFGAWHFGNRLIVAEWNDSESTLEQHSDEWTRARLGKLTGSNLHKIVNAKGAVSKTRKSHMGELMAERFTGIAAATVQTKAMTAGTEMEAIARFAYEIRTGNLVTETGFIDHPSVKGFGASPDGMVDDVHLMTGNLGGMEIKCPESKKAIETLETEEIDTGYILQIYANMLCSVRPWWEFVSYDSRIPEPADLFIKRVPFDAAYGLEIMRDVVAFLSELDTRCKQLIRKRPELAERYAEWEAEAYKGFQPEKKKRSLI